MEENNNKIKQMHIDIILFVIEAIAFNKTIYKDIDNLIYKYKLVLYKFGASSKYNDHIVIKEKNIIQEEYAKKAICIFEFISHYERNGLQTETIYQDITINFISILQKGWKEVYTYVRSNSVINVTKFEKSYLKKIKDLENVTTNKLSGDLALLYYFSLVENKQPINGYDIGTMWLKRQKKFDLTSENRAYEKEYYSYEKIKDEDKIKIKKVRNLLDSKLGKLNSIDDILDLIDTYPNISSAFFTFDLQGISILDLFDEVVINDKLIDEVILTCIVSMEDIIDDSKPMINIDDFIPFFVQQLLLILLQQEYKFTKEYYFKNNREVLHFELEECKENLVKAQVLTNNLENEKKDLNNKIYDQEKEIARLKEQLEKSEDNKNELIGLREFFFKSGIGDKYEGNKIIDISKLQVLKCAVIGGHLKWQEKMKQKFSNYIFINDNNINFDINILDNCDLVFININFMSHALYFKVINRIRKTNKRIVYLTQNCNIDLTITTVYHEIFDNQLKAI